MEKRPLLSAINLFLVLIYLGIASQLTAQTDGNKYHSVFVRNHNVQQLGSSHYANRQAELLYDTLASFRSQEGKTIGLGYEYRKVRFNDNYLGFSVWGGSAWYGKGMSVDQTPLFSQTRYQFPIPDYKGNTLFLYSSLNKGVKVINLGGGRHVFHWPIILRLGLQRASALADITGFHPLTSVEVSATLNTGLGYLYHFKKSGNTLGLSFDFFLLECRLDYFKTKNPVLTPRQQTSGGLSFNAFGYRDIGVTLSYGFYKKSKH